MLSDLRFRVPVLLAGALILHTTVFAELRLFEVMPDIMLLVAVAAGLCGGPGQGAVMGFASGALADLLLPTPLGLSALVFTFVGYVVGVTKGGLLKEAWWFAILSAAVGSAAGVTLFAVVGTVLGQANLLSPHFLAVVVVVSVFNGMLIMPVLKAVGWALAAAPARAFAE